MNGCWFLESHDAPIFVLLGRLGDTIIMLPAFREIHRRTGLKPRIIVSTEYSSIYEGVSYCDPIPHNLHWWQGVEKARQIAAALSDDATLPQWWLGKCPIPDEYRGKFNLTCFGHNWGVNLALWPNFMVSMWERCGFTRDEMLSLPLVFDRRNPAREQALLNVIWPMQIRKKPLLLYNFTGISSPFGFVPELYPVIQRFARDFHICDLGKIKAHRFFDLLGAYDVAAGLISSDTATAHLAHASKVPTIWMTVDSWCGSTPRGNVALHFGYNETPRRLQDVSEVLQSWLDGNSRIFTLPDDRPRHTTSGVLGEIVLGKTAVAGTAH